MIDLNKLIHERLGDRMRHAQQDKFDHIHRFELLNSPLLVNEMYQELAKADMEPEDLAYFFNEYY